MPTVRLAAASLSPEPPQKKFREKYGLATSLVDDFNKQVLLHLPNMELVETLSPFRYRIWLFQALFIQCIAAGKIREGKNNDGPQ